MAIGSWSRIAALFRLKRWKLLGYDTFAHETYPIPGSHFSRAAAERAACRWLSELERSQPSEHSGGQDGIQDQVYIVPPDGPSYRYSP
jgi:hypothetical protein